MARGHGRPDGIGWVFQGQVMGERWDGHAAMAEGRGVQAAQKQVGKRIRVWVGWAKLGFWFGSSILGLDQVAGQRGWASCRPAGSRPGREVGFRVIGLGIERTILGFGPSGLVVCLFWARHQGEGKLGWQAWSGFGNGDENWAWKTRLDLNRI